MKTTNLCPILLVVAYLLLGARGVYSENRRWVRLAANPDITSMTEDDEFYWIGTDLGLYRKHKKYGTTHIYDRSNSSIPSDHVCQVVVHPRTKDLWLATTGGVCRFDGNTFKVPENVPSTNRLGCTSLSIDSNGGIWIALARGEYPAFDALGRIDSVGNYTDVLMDNPGFPG